ncbi:hypothetical protein BGX31_004200 [Mortierella sp. GBA43]|nr:hypothetical protein BGX31_004200 [Mortierella sp. GBA43]
MFNPPSDDTPHSATEIPKVSGGAHAGHGGNSTTLMTESTRAAAANAIVDKLSRGETHSSSHGESAYIPSSLSMLFSDPEVIQAQEEVERAQLHQQQQQLRQRYMDSRRSFSGGVPPAIGLGLGGLGLASEGPASGGAGGGGQGGYGDYDAYDEEGQEKQRLLQVVPGGLQYGFEMMQDDQPDGVYHPYATVMSRSDFLAPHEPSSSSPLFPSPLNTLGRFSRVPDPLEMQRAQAGRVWQDYGSTSNLLNSDPSGHTSYYHSSSNYHYSSHNPDGTPSGAGGHSQQPRTPTMTNDSKSWFQRKREKCSEDRWLCGL